MSGEWSSDGCSTDLKSGTAAAPKTFVVHAEKTSEQQVGIRSQTSSDSKVSSTASSAPKGAEMITPLSKNLGNAAYTSSISDIRFTKIDLYKKAPTGSKGDHIANLSTTQNITWPVETEYFIVAQVKKMLQPMTVGLPFIFLIGWILSI